jgi:hypothetical protein
MKKEQEVLYLASRLAHLQRQCPCAKSSFPQKPDATAHWRLTVWDVITQPPLFNIPFLEAAADARQSIAGRSSLE